MQQQDSSATVTVIKSSTISGILHDVYRIDNIAISTVEKVLWLSFNSSTGPL